MSATATLTAVRSCKVNAICDAPECREPATQEAMFEGGVLDRLHLCDKHARETILNYGWPTS